MSSHHSFTLVVLGTGSDTRVGKLRQKFSTIIVVVHRSSVVGNGGYIALTHQQINNLLVCRIYIFELKIALTKSNFSVGCAYRCDSQKVCKIKVAQTISEIL